MSRIIRSIAVLTVGIGSLGLAPPVSASGALESVSMLSAGAGSSLVVRTSDVAVLVVTTAANPRTVTIDLVGVVGNRRHLTVTGRAAMISHIAVNNIDSSASDTTTRIRVSLKTDYRHRVRTFGNLVYVDFQPLDGFEPSAALSTRAITAARPHGPPAVTTAAPIVHSDTAATYVGAKGRSSHVEAVLAGPLARWSAVIAPVQHLLKLGTAIVSSPVPEWVPLVLKDGTTIYSHGEYAEVNGHLTLLLPFDVDASPRVEVVSIPNAAIDRAATDEALESARAVRYAVSRGPGDFAAFGQRMSDLLETVPSQSNAPDRVRLVEDIVRQLVEWPAAHHGYRAAEIGEAVNVLGNVLNQLRAVNGMHSIVVTAGSSLQPVRALRPPRLVDLLDVAMRIVAFLTVPAERTAVLTAAADSFRRHRVELPVDWSAEGERRINVALVVEKRAEDAYRQLSLGVVDRAMRAAREGDVRAISGLRSDFLKRDAALGARRPDVVVSTMAVLQTQFDAAALVQLDRERRALENNSVRHYASRVAVAARRFRTLAPQLEQLDSLSTRPSKMHEVREQIAFVKRTLESSSPPPLVVEVHKVMVAAVELAVSATRESFDRGVSRDRMNRQQTRAAIEAVTMFERGTLELEAVLRSQSRRSAASR